MKQIKFVITALALVLATSASAEIREAAKMQLALADVQEGDVVVFDIDNTILEPVQTLGSDQWVDHMIERNKQSGLTSEKAVEAALSDWEQVQRATDVRLVEVQTPGLIRRLQSRNIVTLALTARPTQLRATTEDQLASLGVHFAQYGVQFADGKNKGLVLQDFLKRMNLKPRRLIFIDDKAKNVKNMDDAFATAEFPNINYRYGGADQWVKSFSFNIADMEWSFFMNSRVLVSDEYAAYLISRQN